MDYSTDQQKRKWSDDLNIVLKRSLSVLKPPEKMTVSAWADNNRVLAAGESSIPRQWETANTPYLGKIMDCLNDDYIQEIIFLKPSQVGGTEAGINIILYIIDQIPQRVMYILPNDKEAKKFSDIRLQNALANCEVLKGKYDLNSADDMLNFIGGFIRLVSAQTPTNLAGWSIPILIMDEMEKYPEKAGREGSPIALAEERTKTWPNRKVFKWSTPVYASGHIVTAYNKADVRLKFYVPCPFCGKYQELSWHQVKFNSDDDLSVIEMTAYYECCYCGHHILNKDKMKMLRKGRWVAQNEFKGKPRKVAFSLNSLYSPMVTFGMMAKKFMESKDDPKLLQNFINSWLGEPWETKAAKLDIDLVLQKKTECPGNVVPKWAKILVGGVDCQQGYFYWLVRAWGKGMTSQLVAYGRARSFEDLKEVMDKQYRGEDGSKWIVNLYAVDSGYDTDAVYDYCHKHFGVAVPVKGSSRQMLARYRIGYVQPKKDGLKQRPELVYEIDTDQYKNMIASRLHQPVGRGAFMLNADADEEYAAQITSEQRVVQVKGNREVETWVKKTSHSPNHWWDCEVYEALAADILHVRNFDDMEEQQEQPKKPAAPDDSGGIELPDMEL